MLYKDNIDLGFKSKSTDKLLVKPGKLILFAEKTFIILKNFQSGPIIKTFSLKAMFLAIKFD